MKVDLRGCAIKKKVVVGGNKITSVGIPTSVWFRFSDFCHNNSLCMARTVGAILTVYLDEQEARESKP